MEMIFTCQGHLYWVEKASCGQPNE